MRSARLISLLTALLGGLFLFSPDAADAAAAAPPPADAPDFSREVRPILSKYCFKCHGPDDATRKAKLRLDRRDGATAPAKSGARAVVPGQPGESELLKRIVTRDPDEVMPPPSTKMELPAADKELLRRWVTSGAEYREHWAFVLPIQAPLPEVRATAWPRSPIDRFILHRLEAAGLAPSAEADRLTLVRRVTLDLIGLAPTPEEADDFANDPSPEAYEHLVDRLLASPRYGERWARRWMDLARYADTNGYEKDRERSIWPWRDWVIRALNADMPFDRFTLEQVAGDLLPGATPDQRIATGFHRNTMLNEEGGIDPLEFRFNAMTDRVNTTGAAWLGLTLRCVQCHTHKYDPIPQREYYQLMACLNNADEPEMALPDAQLDARHQENLAQAERLIAGLAARFPVGDWIWSTPRPVAALAGGGEKPTLLEDGSVLFSGPTPDKETYTLTLDLDPGEIGALRLEALPHDSLPSKGPGRVAHGNFVLTRIALTAAPRGEPSKSLPARIASARADIEQAEFQAAKALDDDPATGWAVDADRSRLNTRHEAVFTLAKPVGFPGGTRLVVTLEQHYGGGHTLGRLRLSAGSPEASGSTLEARRAKVVEQLFGEWLSRERAATPVWQTPRVLEARSNSPLLTPKPDGSVLASGDITKSDTYELSLAAVGAPITAIRLEALPDESLPARGPGLAYYEGPRGDFFMGEFQVTANGIPVPFSKATESYGRNGFGASASAALAIDGDPQTGWSTSGREGERHQAVFLPREPIPAGATLRVKLLFGRHYACSLGRFRISVTDHPGGAAARDLPEEVERLLGLADSRLTPVDRDRLRAECLLHRPELADARQEIERLRKPPGRTTTLVLRERPPENPRPTFIHKRGEYLQPTDRVEPGVVSIAGPLPPDAPRNRLGFARWLVSTNNPLTARVTVNRQWQAFFGNGIVRTMEDFGFQGESPSHPELLDWLAVEFMRQGWSTKRLHRMIVLSATYRQASTVSPALLARDPENRLMARGPRVRLEAEVVRDAMLRSAGLLSLKMGGPSVYPPQPSGVTEVAYGSPRWPVSTGEDRHRRSVYTFIKRTAPFALFNTFDAPTGESCLARRDSSNTPLQALTLLNDPLLVEVAQAMGRSLAEGKGTAAERIRAAFRRCLTRSPDPAETAALEQFLERQMSRFGADAAAAAQVAGEGGAPAPERAAWTTLVRALLNLDESITKS